MKTDRWISSELACNILRVKPQTLYAYVSRNLIETRADENDPRRNGYSALDIEELAKRNKRPRSRAAVASEAISWGEPVLESEITTVKSGQLYFADKLATECAETYSLEQVCSHHFNIRNIGTPDVKQPIPKQASSKARAYRFLSDLSAESLPSSARTKTSLATESSQLLSGFADAMIGYSISGSIHERLAKHWGLSSNAKHILRAALVMMSDHELNASTFAVRVCASTGASLPGSILSGFSTLNGPLHGDASIRAYKYLSETVGGKDIAQTISIHTLPNSGLPGFGHPLYPSGDPRASFLLSNFSQKSPLIKCVNLTSDYIGHLPNSDAALASIAITFDLPEDAPFIIFAIARTAGWLAHATEQIQSGHLIRPRARFVSRAS